MPFRSNAFRKCFDCTKFFSRLRLVPFAANPGKCICPCSLKFFDAKKNGKGKGKTDNPSTALSRARQAAKDANQFLMRPTLCIGWPNGTCRAIDNCKWCHSDEEVRRVKELESRNTAPTTYLVRNQGVTQHVQPPIPKSNAVRPYPYGTA